MPKTTGLDLIRPLKRLSISSICNFRRCPRKFFYSNLCNLSPWTEEPNFFKFGRALHASAPWALKNDLRKAMEEFDKVWPSDGHMDDDKRNRSRASASMVYLQSVCGEPRGIYSLVEPPKTGLLNPEGVSPFEIPFAIDVGIDVPFVGVVDGLVRHRDTKKLWALEIKSASEMSMRFAGSFEMNPQCIGYPLALQAFVEEDLQGTFVQGILVAKSSVNTLTVPVSVRKNLYEDFLELIQLTREEIEKCLQRGHFPKDLSSCNGYSQFGQFTFDCDFQSLCSVGDWTSLKSMFFQSEPRTFILEG